MASSISGVSPPPQYTPPVTPPAQNAKVDSDGDKDGSKPGEVEQAKPTSATVGNIIDTTV